MDTNLKREIKKHFEKVAPKYDKFKERKKFYYNSLTKTLRKNVPKGGKILEIGCGTGSLLNKLEFNLAVGVDIAKNMIKIAKRKNSRENLYFLVADAEFLPFKNKFDFIIMVDLIEHLDDIYSSFKELRGFCNQNTKIVITSINPTWALPLHVLEWLKLKMPEGPHNWLAMEDMINLLYLLDYKIRSVEHSLLSLIQVIVAEFDKISKKEKMSASIVIPAYNEEKNILKCIERIPNKNNYEIIVIDDGSIDNTAKVVKSLKNPRVKLISYKPNEGKGVAVKGGFDSAKGDVLVILDADMAVPPEEVSRFLEPIEMGKADFVNGTRLIYPMESGAMTDLHMIGNKIFSMIFTWLLNQRVTDTLCGTKSLLRVNYKKYINLKEKSWPDFDLLFQTANKKLKIVEMPVHYKKRVAGKSKMKTLRHGVLLTKMCLKGFWKLKIKKWLNIP